MNEKQYTGLTTNVFVAAGLVLHEAQVLLLILTVIWCISHVISWYTKAKSK